MVLALASGSVTNPATSGQDKLVEIVIYVDNVATPWKQLVQVPPGSSRPWSLLGSVALPGGGAAHNITVKANVTNSGSVNLGPNGTLTVTTLP
jgi:predicted component of type VI protein secretion system